MAIWLNGRSCSQSNIAVFICVATLWFYNIVVGVVSCFCFFNAWKMMTLKHWNLIIDHREQLQPFRGVNNTELSAALNTHTRVEADAFYTLHFSQYSVKWRVRMKTCVYLCLMRNITENWCVQLNVLVFLLSFSPSRQRKWLQYWKIAYISSVLTILTEIYSWIIVTHLAISIGYEQTHT